MRQIFTLRFLAAVGAVIGLFLLLTTFFEARDAIVDDDDAEAVPIHKIDLVSPVFAVLNPDFRLGFDGSALNDTTLVLDAERAMRIVAGTPGENYCPDFPSVGACAIVADLLGEGVVWFAFVPVGANNTVPLPAIDTLDDGIATLVNGWQLPFAPVLDRRCEDEYASYQEFRRELGDGFTTLYSLEELRLSAVECRVRVPYAPPPTTTEPADADTDSTEPEATVAATTDSSEPGEN